MYATAQVNGEKPSIAHDPKNKSPERKWQIYLKKHETIVPIITFFSDFVPNRPQMPEETVQNEEIQQTTEETSDIEEPCEEESL